MDCKEFLLNLSFYIDDELPADSKARCGEHLAHCLSCRPEFAEMKDLAQLLGNFSSPIVPASLVSDVRRAVSNEITFAKPRRTSLETIREWLAPYILPYGIGVISSLFLFITVFAALLSAMNTVAVSESDAANSSTVVLIAQATPSTVNKIVVKRNTSIDELIQSDYASERMSVSAESPSLNPAGALVAMTNAMVRGKMKNEEVVVVANVFGNGLAQIVDVVQPPKDQKSLDDLKKALENDPNYAPFVPASMDKRPETMQVVFKIQTVDVPRRR